MPLGREKKVHRETDSKEAERGGNQEIITMSEEKAQRSWGTKCFRY